MNIDGGRQVLRQDVEQVHHALGVGNDMRDPEIFFLSEREAVGAGTKAPPNRCLRLFTSKKHVSPHSQAGWWSLTRDRAIARPLATASPFDSKSDPRAPWPATP